MKLASIILALGMIPVYVFSADSSELPRTKEKKSWFHKTKETVRSVFQKTRETEDLSHIPLPYEGEAPREKEEEHPRTPSPSVSNSESNEAPLTTLTAIKSPEKPHPVEDEDAKKIRELDIEIEKKAAEAKEYGEQIRGLRAKEQVLQYQITQAKQQKESISEKQNARIVRAFMENDQPPAEKKLYYGQYLSHFYKETFSKIADSHQERMVFITLGEKFDDLSPISDFKELVYDLSVAGKFILYDADSPFLKSFFQNTVLKNIVGISSFQEGEKIWKIENPYIKLSMLQRIPIVISSLDSVSGMALWMHHQEGTKATFYMFESEKTFSPSKNIWDFWCESLAKSMPAWIRMVPREVDRDSFVATASEGKKPKKNTGGRIRGFFTLGKNPYQKGKQLISDEEPEEFVEDSQFVSQEGFPSSGVQQSQFVFDEAAAAAYLMLEESNRKPDFIYQEYINRKNKKDTNLGIPLSNTRVKMKSISEIHIQHEFYEIKQDLLGKTKSDLFKEASNQKILSSHVFSEQYKSFSIGISKAADSSDREKEGLVLFGSGTGEKKHEKNIESALLPLLLQKTPVITGGAGGFMTTAATFGKEHGCRVIGIGVGGGWRLENEAGYERNHEYHISVGGYEQRIPLLLQNRTHVFIAPGGAGTLKEIATLFMQIARMPEERIPHILLIGENYYDGLLYWIESHGIDKRYLQKIGMKK